MHNTKTLPYKALWGKIRVSEMGHVSDEDLALPIRRTKMGGNPTTITWTGPDGKIHRKDVRDDDHAVLTLMKLDTEDNYFLFTGLIT